MHKTDLNQAEIVAALRSVGASVQDLSTVGGGCPDLAVGIFGKTYFMEIKNPKANGKFLASQIIWRDKWKGSAVYLVNTVDEALQVIGINTN